MGSTSSHGPRLSSVTTVATDLPDLGDNAAVRRWLHGLPGVDQVGLEARAASLGTRSIKTTSKAWAIDTAISMIDLTTLEGADTRDAVEGGADEIDMVIDRGAFLAGHYRQVFDPVSYTHLTLPTSDLV